MFGLIKDWDTIMQIQEFRRELQDAILRLQRIAQKIDKQALVDEQLALDTTNPVVVVPEPEPTPKPSVKTPVSVKK